MKNKANVKVLIVDEYFSMRNIIRNILKQMGFNQIEESGSLEDLVSKIKKHDISFVISDWSIKEINAIDCLKEIRESEDENIKNIPFLFVTNNSKKESILQAIEFKANGYVLKPFSTSTLSSKIEQICNMVQKIHQEN